MYVGLRVNVCMYMCACLSAYACVCVCVCVHMKKRTHSKTCIDSDSYNYLFVNPCWTSLLFTIFSHQLLIKKKKEFLQRTYILLIQYLHSDQILVSNSFDNSQICHLKFFSFYFFRNHSI